MKFKYEIFLSNKETSCDSLCAVSVDKLFFAHNKNEYLFLYYIIFCCFYSDFMESNPLFNIRR